MDDPGVAPKQQVGYSFERIGVGLFQGMGHVVTVRRGRSGASGCLNAVVAGSGKSVMFRWKLWQMCIHEGDVERHTIGLIA